MKSLSFFNQENWATTCEKITYCDR